MKMHNPMMNCIVLSAVLFGLSCPMLEGTFINNSNADTIRKPYTFVPGTKAKASEVNSNFDTLYDQVNKIGGTLHIDSSNQNIGIGLSAPNEKLEVDGTVKARAFIGDGSGLTGIYGSAKLDPPYDSQKLRALLAAQNHVTLPEGTVWVIDHVDLATGQSISGPGVIAKKAGNPYALQILGSNVLIQGVKFRPQHQSGQPNCDIKLGDGSRDVQIIGNHFWGTTYSAIAAADGSFTGGLPWHQMGSGRSNQLKQ